MTSLGFNTFCALKYISTIKAFRNLTMHMLMYNPTF